MDYCEIKPSGPAARWIKSYWALEHDGSSLEAQRVLPDGRPVLVFNLGQPLESQHNGAWHRQPQSFVMGQITRPLLLRASGSPAKMLCISFHPHGAGKVLDLPLNHLTDSAVALDDLSAKLHRRLERLTESKSLAGGLAALDATMQALANDCEEDRLVTAAINAFECSNGLADVKKVAAKIGVSSRHLQRRFLDAVGIPPKLFSRMQRFQKVFQTMENHPQDWVSTAIDCGYYDQAHLIRDFKEFSGKAPTALLEDEIALTRRLV